MSNAEAAARNYYHVVDEQGADDVAALFTVDAVYRRPGYPPFVGTQELLTFYSGDRVILSGRHTLDTVFATGDRVAVQGHFHGLLRDGSTADLRFADIFRFEDGQIAERDTYFDAPLV